MPYRIIVGLEVHVELATKSKMFCRCANDPFHAAKPNLHVCPVCLGLPGALPVANGEAIRMALLVGKALGSVTPPVSKWDRKHYFYPDLPKGYQISQSDLPLCVGGELTLLAPNGEVEQVIRFERAHLEEDAGKLLHGGAAGVSRVDLNRAGVPLLEMVSYPDMTSAAQARRVVQELQLLVRTLGVSGADMEKGQLRCDVNINIAFESDSGEIRTPITEVKNVNSTRAVERAITAEAERQYAEWQTGGPIRERKGKLTAGWDEDTEQVTVQRAKEGSADYRYMPEPDLPPLVIATVPHLQSEQLVLPVLPNELRRTFLEKGVALADGELLLAEPVLRSALSTWEGAGVATREAAKWLIQVPGSAQLQGEQAAELVKLCADGQLSLSAIKPHVPELAESGESVTTFAEQRSLLQQHDSAVVELAVAAVLEEQAAAVADYRAGNTRILGFLVGQVMKRSAGKAQPAKVQEAVEAALQSSH